MRLFRRKKTSEKKNEDEKLETDTGIPPPLLMVFKSVQQMDRKPPVTLTLIGVMYFLHVQATRTPSLVLPFVLCPGKVVANKEIGALFIAPFIHLDDLYLYQSMCVKCAVDVVVCGAYLVLCGRLSFLWKGYKLESRLGSIGFCVLLVSLIVLSQGLIVYGAHLISRGAVQECFTGFSGVLTAMKVILNVNSPTFTKLYSFKVPTKYAAWLELFVTYLLVPKLPLLAQAAGLIAGYIYVVTPNADALVGCASQHIRQLLIRIGLIRRPFQWWQIWPKFVDSMSRRRNRRESHRD